MAVPTIAEAINTYLDDCQARNLRPASLITYRRHLGDFLRFTQDAGLTRVEQLDTPILRRYFAGLQARGMAPASIRSHGRVLRIFLNFCVADGIVSETPMQRGRVRMPRQDKPAPDTFTAAEVQQLIKAVRTRRDRAIVLCLLDTGCRVGEFTAWRVDDIDLDAGKVTIRRETAKSRSQRSVFIGQHARTALAEYIEEARPVDRLWLKADRRPLLVKGMTQALVRIAKIAPTCSQHARTAIAARR
jgi:site-specific recombinase XerD